VKVKSISVVQVDFPRSEPRSRPRRPSWAESAEVANPMSRFPKVKRHRSLWLPKWEGAWCRVEAEDGTWGLGSLPMARSLSPVVEHLATQLVGEDCLATDKLADMAFRMTKSYGTQGMASHALSAVDLALWDLKGKLLGQPVWRLLGGAQRDRIPCYCTGNDLDWYLELGFRAFKLACPYGPADGLEGIRKNEEFVAAARRTIGDGCELMLDCWMAFDVEYAVRLAETLRPYRLRWMEECLIPEDMDAHLELRERLPWQGLATGEHWYTAVPFLWAIRHRALDVLQPDICWCGGLTTCRTIGAAAAAAGISVTLHGGGSTVFGQHYSIATPSVPWLECFVAVPPGVPLEEGWRFPGLAIPRDGWLEPNDAPGFGMEIPESWIRPFA
jgi:L-rhamnonate dehydratase